MLVAFFPNSTGINLLDDVLVEAMLTLRKQMVAPQSEAQKNIIQRQIDATDAEIDRLVYALYGLTDEEIAVVEGAREQVPIAADAATDAPNRGRGQ